MLSVGSCFAGVGGIDYGLACTGGFTTRWWSEISEPARQVMAHRFPDAQPLGDIRRLSSPPLVDVIAGGPPCQGISHAQSFGRTGLADPRSHLFHDYARLIRQTSPTWVVMEQVAGLLTSGPEKGADYATVLASFKEIGYALAVVLVNSLAYVPQTRLRLIFVGHRDEGSAARAVLPLLADGASHPGQGRPQGRRPPAGAPAAGAHCYRKGRRPMNKGDHETWVPADYANTLTVMDVGVPRATVIVLDQDNRPRVLTPEEWEACHGFPPGWTQAAGSDRHRWVALGQAVSPPVAHRVGVGILAVEGEGGSDHDGE